MYKELKYTSKITFKLLQLIYLSEEKDWVPYYNFMALKVPDEILDEEPLLVELAPAYHSLVRSYARTLLMER